MWRNHTAEVFAHLGDLLSDSHGGARGRINFARVMGFDNFDGLKLGCQDTCRHGLKGRPEREVRDHQDAGSRVCLHHGRERGNLVVIPPTGSHENLEPLTQRELDNFCRNTGECGIDNNVAANHLLQVTAGVKAGD